MPQLSAVRAAFLRPAFVSHPLLLSSVLPFHHTLEDFVENPQHSGNTGARDPEDHARIEDSSSV
jgi:hypothetical protein